MKLLIMGNNGHLGGLSVHYVNLIGYLKEAGFEIMCINVNDTGDKICKNGEIKEFIVPYKPASILQKIKKVFRLFIAIREARKFAPDLYIATGLGYGYAKVASKLAKATFKVFEEVHFEASADELRLTMVKNFDAVAVQTNGMINQFKSNVSSKKPVKSLPCFSKEYPGNSFKLIPDTKGTIRIAYFGRLAWNKGIREFISAVANVFKNNRDITFDIYGMGSEESVIRQEICDHNLDRQILLKGLYSDDEFPELISSYHGLIMPSIATEGLPLILIEAMRFGRPILSTATGAMPEVGKVNKKGMMVSEKDKQSLETNFIEFLHKLKNNEFEASYINKIYENNFSNEAFKKIWLEMLINPTFYFTETQ